MAGSFEAKQSQVYFNNSSQRFLITHLKKSQKCNKLLIERNICAAFQNYINNIYHRHRNNRLLQTRKYIDFCKRTKKEQHLFSYCTTLFIYIPIYCVDFDLSEARIWVVALLKTPIFFSFFLQNSCKSLSARYRPLLVWLGKNYNLAVGCYLLLLNERFDLDAVFGPIEERSNLTFFGYFLNLVDEKIMPSNYSFAICFLSNFLMDFLKLYIRYKI